MTSFLYGICQLIPLKLWPNTALGCNHQSICMPQLQPLCSPALVQLYTDGYISISNHKSVIVGYIDFQRTFDSISHAKLFKLISYGIDGNLVYWIQAFISDRTQSVRIGATLSSSCMVISGVYPRAVCWAPSCLIASSMISQTQYKSSHCQTFLRMTSNSTHK